MTSRVLLTAYEPYGPFATNASLDCLEALRGVFHDWSAVRVETYPVQFEPVRARIAAAWSHGVEAAVHLGQAPGSDKVRLERQAVNRGRDPYALAADGTPRGLQPLEPAGPPQRCSGWPLEAWADAAAAEGIPCETSLDGGTYLCNAALYWSLQEAERRGFSGQALFVHLPLTPRLAAEMHAAARQAFAAAPAEGRLPPVLQPSLEPAAAALVVKRILETLLRGGPAPSS